MDFINLCLSNEKKISRNESEREKENFVGIKKTAKITEKEKAQILELIAIPLANPQKHQKQFSILFLAFLLGSILD